MRRSLLSAASQLPPQAILHKAVYTDVTIENESEEFVMQYTVVISEKPGGQWQATVPVLPNCTAEASTREAVLEQIRNNLAIAAPKFEVLQIEIPVNGSSNDSLKKSDHQDWPGFGSHPNDPDWGAFFEELDQQRQ